MKTKFVVLIVAIFSLVRADLQAEETSCETPKETAILQLPDHSELNWREIARYVNANEGVIEVIPLNQTTQNWSELIAVQYIGGADWDTSMCSFEKILEHLRNTVLSSYPKGTVSWQIIEKGREGIIYEWILHEPYKNIPMQHEVSRAFLTTSGFHRVGFTRKNGHMNSEERAKWIQLLRENTSVVSFQDGRSIEGFSMVEKLQDSVSVGTHFHGWMMNHRYTFETGYSSVCSIPPIQLDSYVTECLEIVTMPNLNSAPLMNFLEIEKKCVQDQTPKKVQFHILEHSPAEVVYSYCYPKDHLQLNAVVRTFLTERGYYSISYKKGLEDQMQQKEMRSWMEKLKTIRVQDPSKSTKDAPSRLFES